MFLVTIQLLLISRSVSSFLLSIPHTQISVWSERQECFCGQKRNYVETNIIGGEMAEKNEFPWVALLNLTSTRSGLTYRCGATLINERWD